MQTQEQIQLEAVRGLTGEIPLNDFGMPTGIYRTDLLPYHDYVPYTHTHQVHIPHTHTHPMSLADAVTEVVADRVLTLEEFELLDPSDELNAQGNRTPTTAHSFDVVTASTSTSIDVYRIAGFPAKELSHAFLPLQYDEGFPAFDTGLPFWGRLDFEPNDAYAMFQAYLRMPLGVQSNPDDDEYEGKAASGTRSLAALAASFSDSDASSAQVLAMVEKFQEYYHLYYWSMRAHAYDLFRVAQYRKQQELRAIETQDEHYVQSRRLRHRLMKYMDDEENFWDLMTPKIGLDMLKTITQLERISAGIPGAGPMSEIDRDRAGAPFEVTLRNVAQTNRRSQGVLVTDEGEVLDNALKDPAATEILQELIIRSGGR